MTLPWRRIEAALISTALSFGYELIEEAETGDKYLLVVSPSFGKPGVSINLTEAAKVMEGELQ